MRIYITHCSAKKDSSLRGICKKVTLDRLYTATPLQRFIRRCKEREVCWAIFSAKYGIWLPHEEHEWYEKDPDTVTKEEFENLLKNFEEKIGDYDEIYFYHNPCRFHPLYKKLLEEIKVKGKVTPFSHLDEIL